jgi:hypothetical protein
MITLSTPSALMMLSRRTIRIKERERLFAVIARRGFEKEVYSHDEVFGDLWDSP